MRNYCKLSIFLCVVLLLTLIFDGRVGMAASAPKLSQKSISFNSIGSVKTITIKNVKSKNIKKLKVKSSNTRVAQVTKNGKTKFSVISVSAGKATVKATVSLKKAVKGNKNWFLNLKVTVTDSTSNATLIPSVTPGVTATPNLNVTPNSSITEIADLLSELIKSDSTHLTQELTAEPSVRYYVEKKYTDNGDNCTFRLYAPIKRSYNYDYLVFASIIEHSYSDIYTYTSTAALRIDPEGNCEIHWGESIPAEKPGSNVQHASSVGTVTPSQVAYNYDYGFKLYGFYKDNNMLVDKMTDEEVQAQMTSDLNWLYYQADQYLKQHYKYPSTNAYMRMNDFGFVLDESYVPSRIPAPSATGS